MRRVSLSSLLVLGLASGTASAHATLDYPPPRTLENKTGPCGAAGSTRGSNVTTFSPGATITVQWRETVDHPGHYRISFDTDGNQFQNPSTPDDAFPETLLDDIQDKSGGSYTAQVTLPNTPCTNCTLQLIQIMTTTVPYNSFYFQCADITLAEGGGSGDPPPPADDAEGGCSTGAGAGWGAALIAIALVRRRRR
ncbi:MAG TPA: SCE4755 family polysaccharide monooxygenase-like protein [Kofleriaceae bacterium]|nr:SCE4755 family polysaccharide monooxygenase-like protein [Kofleriaceae bacterium]